MGAETFIQSGFGPGAQAAFDEAVGRAQYDNGHGGYSGTLAEKTEFVEIILPGGQDIFDFAQALIDKGDDRVDDKWGPAGALKFPDEDNRWLFFGWASS